MFYAELKGSGFTIRVRCGSKCESIKVIKKLRLEVYNRYERNCRLLYNFRTISYLKPVFIVFYFLQERFVGGSSLSDVQSMHPSCICGVDDMIQLGELTEAAILRNLFIRYHGHKIYVRFKDLAFTP